MAVLLVMAMAVVANACDRCGLRNCRFQQVQQVVVPSHVQQVVTPVVEPVVQQVAVPQQVINISNVYPQGSTVYTVGQVSQLYASNPDLAMQLTARIAENGIGALKAAIESGNTNNQALLNLATVQAATEHLKSATTAQLNAGNQSLNLRITQGASGIKVEQINGDVTEKTVEPMPVNPMTPVDSGKPVTGSLLSAKCAQCHGKEMTQPKGGLFFDAGLNLDSNNALLAINVVNGRDVPSSMAAVVEGLTAEERSALTSEILSLWKRE